MQIVDPLRGRDAYIIQTLSPPVNDNLMELLLLISATKRAGCRKVTAVIPYCAYTRDILPDAPDCEVPNVGCSLARIVPAPRSP